MGKDESIHEMIWEKVKFKFLDLTLTRKIPDRLITRKLKKKKSRTIKVLADTNYINSYIYNIEAKKDLPSKT